MDCAKRVLTFKNFAGIVAGQKKTQVVRLGFSKSRGENLHRCNKGTLNTLYCSLSGFFCNRKNIERRNV